METTEEILGTNDTERPRHISNEARGPWVKYYYDLPAAKRAVRFIEKQCIHTEGTRHAGKAFKLLWWQRRIVLKLAGWKRRSDGMRRFRVVFLFIPKKNGKTFFESALCNYFAFADKEPSAHVALLAADKEQAGLAFNFISSQIRANPKMERRAEVYKRSAFIPESLSSIRVLSRSPGGKHGPNWHVVMVDEGHAIKDHETVQNVTAGIIARTQPVTMYASTAGISQDHWFYELYLYAKRIAADQSVNEEWLVAVYEANPDKWEDRSEWVKANPSMGVTFNLEDMERQYQLAKDLPTERNKFKRLHLNIWTEDAVAAIPMERWNKCVGGELEMEYFKNKPCYIGCDLASSEDFASIVQVFPPFRHFDIEGTLVWESTKFVAFAKHYFPRENIKLRKEKLSGLDITPWAEAGWVTLIEGEVIDYGVIEQDIIEMDKLYDVREVAFDPWNAVHFANRLGEIYGFQMVKMRQGFATISDPTKQFLAHILKYGLDHRGNPVLDWNARNLRTVEDPAGNIKPHKGKSKDKIDGISAFIMGFGRALVNVVPVSTYETNEVKVMG